MGKNRRAGRKHTVKPKMWIRCVCGQTLSHVDRPRHPDGRPTDPLWMIGGLSYSHMYNSNDGNKYEHDHFDKVHTHTFKCEFTQYGAPGVLEASDVVEPDFLDEMGAENALTPLEIMRVKSRSKIAGEPYEDALQRAIRNRAQRLAEGHHKENPARYTEAGVTQRPRDIKRDKRRCGRVHTVRGQRVLDRWNELAGITEDTPPLDAMRAERAAYLAADKNWVMILGE